MSCALPIFALSPSECFGGNLERSSSKDLTPFKSYVGFSSVGFVVPLSAISLFGTRLNFVPRKLNPTDFNFIDPEVLASTIIFLACFIFSLNSTNCFGFNALVNSSKFFGFTTGFAVGFGFAVGIGSVAVEVGFDTGAETTGFAVAASFSAFFISSHLFVSASASSAVKILSVGPLLKILDIVEDDGLEALALPLALLNLISGL